MKCFKTFQTKGAHHFCRKIEVKQMCLVGQKFQAKPNPRPGCQSSANPNWSPGRRSLRQESLLANQDPCTRLLILGFQLGSSTGTSLSSLPWHHPAPGVFHRSTLSSRCRKSRRAFFANLQSTTCNKILLHGCSSHHLPAHQISNQCSQIWRTFGQILG